MTNLEQIQSLFAELGPKSEEIAAVAQNGDAEWAIVYDEDLIVTADYDEDQSKILLSAGLGTPPRDARLSVYEAALNYSYLWRDTGGLFMALGGPEGEIFMMFELNAADVSLDTLQMVLRQLVSKAQVWQDFVAAGGDAEAADASLATTFGLRV